MNTLLLDAQFDSSTIPILLCIICLIVFLFIWIKTLNEINRSQFASDTTRTLWILFVGFMPALGLIAYYLVGRKRRIIL